MSISDTFIRSQACLDDHLELIRDYRVILVSADNPDLLDEIEWTLEVEEGRLQVLLAKYRYFLHGSRLKSRKNS